MTPECLVGWRVFRKPGNVTSLVRQNFPSRAPPRGVAKGQKGQITPGGNQERRAKNGGIKGHQASQDFWWRLNCIPPRAPITHATPLWAPTIVWVIRYLSVPSTRLRTIRDRAFPAAASRTWNSLSPEVTSSTTLSTFQSKLETYLFSLSFPDL